MKGKILFLILAVMVGCKSQSDFVSQSQLEMQMDNFYGSNHKIISLSINSELSRFFGVQKTI